MAFADRLCSLLLVDDDTNDKFAIMRALKMLLPKLLVSEAGDGHDALQLLQGADRPPDLLIVDLKMPRIDGAELVQELRLRDEYKIVPIVIFNSTDEPMEIERCLKSGASQFVRKPIDILEFERAVQSIVSHWLPHRCGVT